MFTDNDSKQFRKIVQNSNRYTIFSHSDLLFKNSTHIGFHKTGKYFDTRISLTIMDDDMENKIVSYGPIFMHAFSLYTYFLVISGIGKILL